MPRKQFLADLKEAQAGPLPFGVQTLRAGDDDGQFELLWKSADVEVQITALVSDVADYPSSHTYMIFCGENATPEIAAKLESIHRTDRKTIIQLTEILVTELSRVSTKYDSDTEILDNGPSGSETDMEDEDMSECEDDDDDGFLTGIIAPEQGMKMHELDKPVLQSMRRSTVNTGLRNRLAADLKAVKEAGFRVGVIGDLAGGSNGFLALSIRISKLGISDEAMQAWQIEADEYLMLLIYYPVHYATNEELQSAHVLSSKSLCVARFFASKTYKPTRKEALMAFQTTDSTMSEVNSMPNLKLTFLSRPFIRLLNEDLIALTRFREMGMDWAGAEKWLRDREGVKADVDIVDGASASDKYFEPETIPVHYPDVVTADEYASRDVSRSTHSFPLVAMQFTLRHFVRCTEFCVICHRKIDTKINEAIKPYVCQKQLCLFQYMAMGFGPSIEHEIMSQPDVVDLLVSFCYSAAVHRRLTDLPTGLGIKVPSTKSIQLTPAATRPSFGSNISNISTVEETIPDAKEYDIIYDQSKQEIHFLDQRQGGCPAARGAWVVIRLPSDISNGNQVLHCRVTETTFFPIIRVHKPVHAATIVDNQVISDGLESLVPVVGELGNKPKQISCKLRCHDLDFDSLSRDQKCDAICQMLNILPGIKEMQTYLQRSTTKDLKYWSERIPSSALQLLQWIIASNRACLMQVDDKERISGMSGYTQFRFAMGAPDKEERFMSEVKNTTQRLKLRYPTIFAWHGSPLYNWHTIIREGLHFNFKDHGRAYGDGVYHAKDANTSVSYCSRGADTSWPNSTLKVGGALALNELVNAPTEFRSHSPYYVVSQLDWIQTRYLLVTRNDRPVYSHRAFDTKEDQPSRPHLQDPTHTPRGVSGAVGIPASAIKTGTTHDRRGTMSPSKRLKTNSGDVVMIDSDFDSDLSDDEDLAALSPAQTSMTRLKSNGVQSSPVLGTSITRKLDDEDFVPGELDYSTLPLMPLPTYANSATTRRLMNEIRDLQKTMNTTPQQDLGWYLDTSRLDNVYQWIVELHSFHTFEVKGKRLPMADDMKAKKIKSVVLEIRYGADFPHSPPYVRVIRPRFLTFNEGGGGHIVMGGAMCMELLTNTGWSSVSSIESVLMQVRMAMASEPFARLSQRSYGDYGIAEAADGFIRACKTHGWTEPPGFKEIAYGMPTAL